MFLTPPVQCLSTHAVHLSVPLGDDSHRILTSPIYGLVQITIPISDDGHRMSLTVRQIVQFYFSSRQCGGCMILLCHGHLPSVPSVRLFLLLCVLQLTRSIGDDGQLMSSGSWPPPVLWLSTHAVQLTVPIGDDGQLMSGGSWPYPSYGLLQIQFKCFVACGGLFIVFN